MASAVKPISASAAIAPVPRRADVEGAVQEQKMRDVRHVEAVYLV